MAIAGLNLDARIVRHGELRSLFAKNTSAAFATLANVFHNSGTNLRNLKNKKINDRSQRLCCGSFDSLPTFQRNTFKCFEMKTWLLQGEGGGKYLIIHGLWGAGGGVC